MIITTVVVDNFLDNPDAVRNSALSLNFYETGEFPGIRSDRADGDYEIYIQHKIEKILNCKIKEWVLDSFRFQLCLEGEESWVHRDPCEWAGILYLTPNAPLEAGTGIYKGDLTNSELVNGIGNVYNRIILYPGEMLHRSIVSGFGSNKETGRLTQTFFFNLHNYE